MHWIWGLNTAGAAGEPLEIFSSQSRQLWDGLCRAYGVLGFDSVLGGDEVLRDLACGVFPLNESQHWEVTCPVSIRRRCAVKSWHGCDQVNRCDDAH